ncbi:MAG: hypothetical protein H6839_01235 [Planctomycetes bacterium]|nr:hypothetical protein [Planctomycetota bacterium]
MGVLRSIAVVALLIGVVVLGYGLWNYFQPAHRIELDDAKSAAGDAATDARNAVEDADVSPAIWIGGFVILVAGVAMFASSRNRRRDA